MILTPSGVRLQARVAPVIEELRSALEEFEREADHRRRTVTVAASPIVAAVLVPPILRRFRQTYPDVKVVLRDDVPFERLSALVAEIKSGAIDIAVTALAGPHPEVEYEPLVADECIVVGPRPSLLVGRPQITLEELAREPFVTLAAYTADVEALAAELGDRGITFRPSYQVANVTTLLGLVESGMGLALLPRFALRSTDASEAGRFVTSRLVGASMVRRIGMLHLRRAELVPTVASLSRAFRAESDRDDGFGRRPCETAKRQPALAAINR